MKNCLVFVVLAIAFSVPARSQDPSYQINKKVEATLILHAEELAKNAVILEAVLKANKVQNVPGMTNQKWKKTAVSSPVVQALMTNAAAQELEKKKLPIVSEIFISAADGTKVAFLDKTSSWSHKGKPKHDIPMTGKVWVGKIELDESSGVNQFQISVPILDLGKPVGSIVVGASATKL